MRNISFEFTPADETVFLREAIRVGRVLLTPVLDNGNTLEPSIWHLSDMQPTSRLRGNILSRKEFRVGVLDQRVVTVRATLLP